METGRVIDNRYKIITQLGEETYIAENIGTKVKWVLKTMPGVGEETAGILRMIRHPSLPRIFEYLSIDDRNYYVLEYIEGSTLRELCIKHGGRLDFRTACEYMSVIAGVVEFLHTHAGRPLLHLDIKPGNIVVSYSGTPCLIDFGCMKVMDPLNESGNLTESGAGIMNPLNFGTPGYAPPELASGKIPEKASDIFMIGATLLRVITGLNDTAPVNIPLRELAAYMPASVAKIIGKCIMNAPGDRYGNACELASDLRNIVKGSIHYEDENIPAATRLSVKDMCTADNNDNPDIGFNDRPSPKTGAGIKRQNKADKKIICIWGNSSFACELSYVLAAYDKKVMLIDADLLSPSVDLLSDIRKAEKNDVGRQSGNCSLGDLMEEYARSRLTCDSISVYADRTGSASLHCICGKYRMEDYEYYSTEGLANIIRTASQCNDFVIVACNKFIYDEFTCISLICCDLAIIPLAANNLSFREYSRYVKFMCGRKQINADRLAYVGFEYQPNEDFSSGTCDQLCDGKFAGSISYSPRRRMLAGSDKSYAANMEVKIEKQYQAIIKNLKILQGR
ncbi:MAG: protein kinase domain-containing protein [Saccharofermentanales bacterium]